MKLNCLRALPVIILATTLSGCASDLIVKNGDGKPQYGIPVSTYELWVEDGVYTKASGGKPCDVNTPYHKIVSLASGPKVYISATKAGLAKYGLNVKLNGDGAATEIAFNSESQAPAAIDSVANLIKAVPLAALGAGAPAPNALPACDAGDVPTKRQLFSEWRKNQ